MNATLTESTKALMEVRADLLQQGLQQILRDDISSLKSAIGGRGYETRLQESAAPGLARQLTPDYFANEAGWGQLGMPGLGWPASPDDRLDGADALVYKTPDDLAFIRQIGRFYSALDEVGMGLRDTVIDYIIGDRMQIRVEPREKGQDKTLVDKLQKFLDLFAEQNGFHGVRDREPMCEAIADGEALMIPEFKPDLPAPRIKIRTCDHLADPLKRAPEMTQRLGLGSKRINWSFGIGTPADDNSDPVAYYFDWYGQGNYQVIPATRVVHAKLNSHEECKRGVSEYYCAHQSLKRAATGLQSAAQQAAIQTTIAYIEELAADTTAEAVEAALLTPGTVPRQIIDALGRAQTINQKSFKGSEVVMTSGSKFHMGPMGSPQGAKLVLVFDAVLRRVATRFRMPQYFLTGDPSNSAMASTVVAETPWHRATKTRQAFWSSKFVELCWKTVALAMSTGQLSGLGLDVAAIKQRVRIVVEFPDPSERDKLEEETIREIRHNARVLSAKTWQQEVGLDPETEESNFEDEDSRAAERAETMGEIPLNSTVGGGLPIAKATSAGGGLGRGALAGRAPGKGKETRKPKPVAREFYQAAKSNDWSIEERREVAAAVLYGDQTVDGDLG